MEWFGVLGVTLVCGGFVATVIVTWINLAESIYTDRRLVKLDTQRYELEKRICELEEWRNS